jgi:glycine betaine/proline transport system ATP-binding protein
MTPALAFEAVDILFDPGPGRSSRRAYAKAMDLLTRGATRNDIVRETGVVLGVCGASFNVEPGEICVLMGLSGSGKSTLLRAANGLNRLTRGKVRVDDGGQTIDLAQCDAKTLRRLRRERIAMVFQHFGLLPWRTVRENVAFGLELSGVGRRERLRVADEKLELVGLAQWGDRYASELSGGMQQRVGLARAFASDADILLMDEPFSALDPLIRSKLQDELLELQARLKKTILFVSHDLDEALKLGDQIVVLREGRIDQRGAPEDIVLRPATAYVAEFVQHMNPLSVLTGADIMRSLNELTVDGAGFRLDEEGRYRIELDRTGSLPRVFLDGAPYDLLDATATDPPHFGANALILAPADSPLLTLIRLCHSSGSPVLLVKDGQFQGVCGPAEIMRALSRSGERQQSSRAPS